MSTQGPYSLGLSGGLLCASHIIGGLRFFCRVCQAK